jgi:hypothetical protein
MMSRPEYVSGVPRTDKTITQVVELFRDAGYKVILKGERISPTSYGPESSPTKEKFWVLIRDLETVEITENEMDVIGSYVRWVGWQKKEMQDIAFGPVVCPHCGDKYDGNGVDWCKDCSDADFEREEKERDRRRAEDHMGEWMAYERD